MILSYILHGHVPTYDLSTPHPEPLLHDKLKQATNLLDLDVETLTAHFSASRFSYSTQALPVNVLLDTLIRPLGETDDHSSESCIIWKSDPKQSRSHVVLGNTARAGGQWVDNPVKASLEIGTLSYAGMLSLPGYSFLEHYWARTGKKCPPFLRPSRRLVADYFATYPSQVGIDDALYCGQTVGGVSRTPMGFHIASHNISCKHLVLASGTFGELVPARPLLQPLLSLPTNLPSPEPLLVIGSGFSAADMIISAPPSQKLIHIFKWAPDSTPSPLRACHQQAYPEYAGVYKQMKLAALTAGMSKDPRSKGRRPSSFDVSRDWSSVYEGLPNTVVDDVKIEGKTAMVTLRANDGSTFQRRISGLAYLVGRRGSLDYLEADLRKEVWPESNPGDLLTGTSLREKANESLEVAENVYIVGSLTGDSLVRFACGSCVWVAGRILNSHKSSGSNESSGASCGSSKTSSPFVQSSRGLEGHNEASMSLGDDWDGTE